MRLCFPTMGNNGLKEKVFDHFGSAAYFTVYDTEKKAVEILENNNQHHEHGACQPLNIVNEGNIDVIMTNGMGRRAVQLLNEGGIKVFLLEGNTVEEAVTKFQDNKLTELTIDNACGGHGCH